MGPVDRQAFPSAVSVVPSLMEDASVLTCLPRWAPVATAIPKGGPGPGPSPEVIRAQTSPYEAKHARAFRREGLLPQTTESLAESCSEVRRDFSALGRQGGGGQDDQRPQPLQAAA